MKIIKFILFISLLSIIQVYSIEPSNEIEETAQERLIQKQLSIIEQSSVIPKLVIPDSTQTQIVELNDGSTFIGRIVEIGDQEIKFETKHGIMSFSVFEIAEMKLVSANQFRKGVYWYPNPNTSRLFFAPTGRMLKQGEGYFADYFIFFPTLTFGITNNITLGGGFSILPGLDLDKQILLFTPKFGIKTSKKVDLAIGALAVKLPEDGSSVGILYGVSTFGSLDNSITAGLGYGYFDDKLADRPIIVLGGEIRTSRNISFVSENWIIPELEAPILSGRIRFFGNKLSADFAMIFVFENNITVAPYIDFVYKF